MRFRLRTLFLIVTGAAIGVGTTLPACAWYRDWQVRTEVRRELAVLAGKPDDEVPHTIQDAKVLRENVNYSRISEAERIRLRTEVETFLQGLYVRGTPPPQVCYP